MIPAPRGNPFLAGHEQTEQTLLAAIMAGHLPHALIFSGESGIGKATLAYRLARYLLAQSSERTAGSLVIDAKAPVARRIAAASHGDLISIERQQDVATGKTAKEIAVDDVRRIVPFLRMTSADDGWRIAIVDEAAALNRSGQNALLKILEEPPPRSLLILVTDRPGLLLPTIHSRCRMIRMAALSDKTVDSLLQRYAPELVTAERQSFSALSQGSIGKALQLIESEGLAMYGEIVALMEPLPQPDWQKIHSFAERLALPGAEHSYHLFTEFLPLWIGQLVKCGLSGPATEIVANEGPIRTRLLGLATLDRWLDACEKITQRLATTDSANLDRKLAVWAAFEMMSKVVA